MKSIILLVILSFNFTYSQIDTTNWLPLEVGNKWEYVYGIENEYNYTVEVVGETLMPNGKKYAIVEGAWPRYQRNQDNQFVYFYDWNDTTEYLLYDFVSEDGTFWEHPYETLFWGIQLTGKEYDYYLNKDNEYKLFDWVTVDTLDGIIDTIWNAMLEVYPRKLSKGIGVKSYNYAHNVGAGGMIGCIINGDTLGIITSVKSTTESINNFQLFQNYPNPFNPETTIKYSIPSSNKNLLVTLKIYDILGKEIKTLVNKEQSSGIYEVKFNGTGLASGVYLYKLDAGNFSDSKKFILMK